MKKLYVSQNIVFIQLLKSKLEAEGIQVFIKNEYPPAAGEITPAVAWPELHTVNDHDVARAKEILNQALADERPGGKHWTCAHCGEKLESQFNLCWSCGASKD